MKCGTYILLSVLFLCIVSSLLGCQKGISPTLLLQQAESLMETNPDTAYLLLKKADATASFNRAQRAEWNLLVTQAMDKTYRKHTTDSLIRAAVDYYEQGENPDRLLLAYYYIGRVAQDLGDAPRAQEYYLKALGIEAHKTDNYLLALINDHIGSLYTRQRVYDKALPYLKDAFDYMKKAENAKGLSFVLRDMGRVYRQLGKIDEAITYYTEALENADEISRPSILVELSNCHIALKESNKAQSYLQEALSCVNDSIDYYTTCLTLGRFYLQTNPDTALYYLQESEKSKQLTTQAASLLGQIKIAKQKKEWEKYAALHIRYSDIETLIARQKHTNAIRETEQLYNYQLMEKDITLSQLQNTLLKRDLALVFLFSACILFLFFWYIRTSHKKEKEWENHYQKMLKEHQKKEKKVEEDQYRINELEHILKTSASNMDDYLREKKRLELNMKQVQNAQINKKEIDILFKQTSIYKLFHNTTNLGEITKENMNELICEINIYYPNFRSTLIHYLPQITETDLQICYLLKTDMGTSDIGHLLSTSITATSMRKRRLFEKLFQVNSAITDLQSFIHSLF